MLLKEMSLEELYELQFLIREEILKREVQENE